MGAVTSRRDIEAAPAPSADEIAEAIAVLLRAATRQSCAAGANMPEPLMTPDEAAEFARVSPDTIERWRLGGLRSYGARRVRRYRGSDIIEFLSRMDRGEDASESIEARARRAAREVQGVRNGFRFQAR